MKQSINGFRYDTEKAIRVFDYSFGNAGDFRRQDFSVYRSQRGHWFIAGSGGPLTRFARPAGDNSWRGGSRIIPLSPEDVLDLAEQVQDDVDVDQVFDFPEIVPLLEYA